MQLGTRWRAGAPPHRSVPETMHAAIADAEAAFPDAEAWTLTWLEGRPVCELDDVRRLELSPTGEIVSRPHDSIGSDALKENAAEDDDDWLA